MEEQVKSEIVVYSGVCRCCFQGSEKDFKGLWDEYDNGGTRETYGDMIVECFALPWQRPEDKECKVEEICSSCVDRLRDAYNFKQQMIMVEEQLRQFFNEAQKGDDNKSTDDKVDIDTTGNTDAVADIQCKEAEETEQTMECDDGSDSDFDPITFEQENDEDSEGEDELMNEDQMDTKITDDDIQGEENKEINGGSGSVDRLENEEQDTNVTKNEQNIRKRPNTRRGRKGVVLRKYRTYPIENMESAVTAVREGKLSRSQAASKYNVPLRTLAKNIWRKTKEAEDLKNGIKVEKKFSHEENPELIEEIKKIIMYTNATIYKSSRSFYYCAYCYLDGPMFLDPEDMRTHTRTEHVSDKITGVELLMRPYAHNEIVKIDILNLCCTICCTTINNWFEMFSHFEKIHKITFDQACTKVIPYELKTMNMTCSICKDPYRFYHNLDSHMNCHYNNYICEDCGDSFLSLTRLKSHVLIHTNTKYSCEFCGKIFSHIRNRRKHYKMHHMTEPTIQCKYCPEKFFANHQMHKHIAIKHKEKVVCITCELCGKVFDLKFHYTTHMATVHKKHDKYKCSKCDWESTNVNDYKIHKKSHYSNYCDICDRNYSTEIYLKQHKQKAHGDEENSKEGSSHYCDICDRNYSSGVYLRQHISKAHGDLEENAKSQTTHYCDVCDRNYSSAVYLKQHKQKAHGEKENHKKGNMSHYCDICDRNYSSADYLKQHKWKCHEMLSTAVVLVDDSEGDNAS